MFRAPSLGERREGPWRSPGLLVVPLIAWLRLVEGSSKGRAEGRNTRFGGTSVPAPRPSRGQARGTPTKAPCERPFRIVGPSSFEGHVEKPTKRSAAFCTGDLPGHRLHRDQTCPPSGTEREGPFLALAHAIRFLLATVARPCRPLVVAIRLGTREDAPLGLRPGRTFQRGPRILFAGGIEPRATWTCVAAPSRWRCRSPARVEHRKAHPPASLVRPFQRRGLHRADRRQVDDLLHGRAVLEEVGGQPRAHEQRPDGDGRARRAAGGAAPGCPTAGRGRRARSRPSRRPENGKYSRRSGPSSAVASCISPSIDSSGARSLAISVARRTLRVERVVDAAEVREGEHGDARLDAERAGHRARRGARSRPGPRRPGSMLTAQSARKRPPSAAAPCSGWRSRRTPGAGPITSRMVRSDSA